MGYHVLPEEVLSTQLKPFQAVTTVEGKPLHVQEWGGKVHVGPSLESKDLKNVIKADNKATNGVVHIIDGVLLPPSTDAAVPELQSWRPNIVQLAEHTRDLSTLVSAVVAAGLADTLSSAGKFTVFAPTNEAFKSLPAGTLASLMKPENKAKLADILKYHVLPEKVLYKQWKQGQAESYPTVEGKKVQVLPGRKQDCSRHCKEVIVGNGNGFKNIIKADNLASNGVVHIIDGVLLPPTAQPKEQNIVQLAEHTPDLSTLVSAVVATGLADTLSSAGKFTVFAPTNEAFKALPAGVLDSLMKPENKAKLVDILKYHVLPEEVLSTQLKPFQAVTTVEGKPLHVQEWGGKVRVGPSLESEDLKNVIKADNKATNGVVHIIDGVLIPPQPT